MEKIFFTKIHGAGNDFILIDTKLNSGFTVTPDLVRALCRRRFSIGADGVIVISDSEKYDFVMDYYNSDGSLGSLCGNGARSAIRYAEFSNRLENRNASFTNLGNIYSGEVIDNELIKFNLNQPSDFQFEKSLVLEGRRIPYNYINTGSPHIVINFPELNCEESFENFDILKLGKKLRFADEFAPAGTNVNFIKFKNGKIQIRTYERGVEDETFACGTGATASAIVGYFQYEFIPPVELETKFKEKLIVDFSEDGKVFNNLSLIGPAEIVFSGEYTF